MTRFDETAIADALLSAPGWARVGLCAPTTRIREDAARELARSILERDAEASLPGQDQERLPL